MEMFATPLRGAESTPSAWSANGTLLNGGGFGFNSFGSHKRYTYEWPSTSTPQDAQKMKSYFDGTYGRGLVYFLEPGIYGTNVLPASWADPSKSVRNDAPSLVYDVEPSAVPTSGSGANDLPVQSAQYDLSTVSPRSTPTPDSSVFIPIPPGHTLLVGAFYSATGSGGVFASPVNQNGAVEAAVRLTPKGNTDPEIVTDEFSGNIRGVRLWVGREDALPSLVTLTAMCARLLETSDLSSPAKVAAVKTGPWVGGQGNSGCRFAGPPSYVTNGPINGGQIGFAASFVEVGSWVYG